MKRVLAQVLSLALVGSTLPANAQQAAPTKKTAKKGPAAPSVASQLKTMSDALAAQQKQIEDLRQELQTRDQAVQQLQQRLDQSQTAASAAQAKADSASAAAGQQAESVTALRSDVNADHQAPRDVGQDSWLSRSRDDWRNVAGRCDVHPVQRRVDHRVQHGRHGPRLEVLHLAVQLAEYLGGV